MKNTILKVGLFNLGLSVLGLNSTLTQAGVVDFSKCGVNSSFAVVTQSEGPTYACGGIDNGVGNPINVLNGNKFEAVEDFKELPAFKGLSFSRFYNSQSNANTALGYGWYSSFDIKLYEQPEIIQIRLDSGQRINFKKNKIPLGNNQFVVRALPLNPSDGWIEKKIDGSGWVWHKTQSNQDYLFQYLGGKDPSLAHITKITAQADIEKNNPQLNFNFYYDQQQRLSVVKNLKGDQLSFQYSTTQFGLPQIILTTPVGRYYYFLDKHHNLAQVLYPDGRRFKYSYDPKFQGGDIHNLTAKWSFDQTQNTFKLISQWQYDQQDRAILSQHANGVEKVSIQFDARTHKNMPANYSNSKAVFKNIVTNSLGQKTTYTYQIDGTQFQLLESLGAGCASCGEVNKRYRFNPQGLVAYAADLDPAGKVIRAIELKYNDLGEVIARTVSGVGIQSQTTNYEYESYQVQKGNMADDLANASSPLLTQLNQQDYRRLKSESRASVVAGKQYRKEYQYNSNNQLISVKETGFSPLGDTLVRETRYGYDKQGRLSWEDGPLPNGPTNSPQDSDITQYVYNATNPELIDHIVYPQGLSAKFQYDKFGRIIANVDINGVLTEYIYNTSSALLKHVQRGKGWINLEYDFLDRPILWKNHLGQSITAKYDDHLRHISYILPDGQRLVKGYDTELRTIQSQWFSTDNKPLFSAQKISYLDNHIQTKVTNLAPISTSWNDHQQIQKLNQDRYKTQFQFDPIGRLLIHQQNEAVTKIQYDDIKKQIKMILPTGAKYQRNYDDFGRLVWIKEANTGHQFFTYNENNQLIKVKDAQREHNYQYDILGNITHANWCSTMRNISPTNCENIDYKYKNGHLVTVSNPIQTIQYDFNNEGVIVSEVVKFTRQSQQWSTYYEYDILGRISLIKLPEGATIQYHYNTISQLSQLDYQPAAKNSFIRILRKVIPNFGKIVLIKDIKENSTYGIFGYTSFNGLKSLAGYNNGLLQTWQDGKLNTKLKYDQHANITDLQRNGIQINSLLKPFKQQLKLEYNIYNQISQVSENGHIQKFKYDLNGNRTAKITAEMKIKYGYLSKSDQLQQIKYNNGEINYKYNAGDPIYIHHVNQIGQSKRKEIISYGARGQLTHITRSDTKPIEYEYNAYLQRVSKYSNNEKIQYLWDNGLVSAEINQRTSEPFIAKRYIYIGIRPVAFITYDEKGDVNYYAVHSDHLNTPHQITDKMQKVIWQAEYDVFGSAKVQVATLQKQSKQFNVTKSAYAIEANNQKNIISFNLRFAGQYYDTETGYHYNWHRYYNPETGRYLTSDPIGLSGGLNTYSYSGQNPVMEIDPWGLLSYNPSNKNFYIDSGDTLQTIAKQIGISSNAIANFNPNFFVNGDISKFKPGVFVAGAEIKVPQLKNVTAFKTAVSLIGSTQYAYATENGDFSAGTNKCNLFVYDVLTRAGYSAPVRKRFGIVRGPATAGSLANDDIPNTKLVSLDQARIGDVMSWAMNYSDATGHTTIYTGAVNIIGLPKVPRGQVGTIGAGEKTVNYNFSKSNAMVSHGYTIDAAKIRRIEE